ncbi:MAG: helix-turn-helix transcriptional regulator [Alphaproteobacteria bacterium]|nr:MAG: helix-turn-helix transcriptional regulator [Alphaproteobacteria bacterium]
MATVGTEAFFPAFRKLVRAKMPFATFLIMRFVPGKAPEYLDIWHIADARLEVASGEYADSIYSFDPFFQFTDIPESGGLYRLPEIAPDRFFSSQYYLEYYRKTGLCDEVGLLAPMPSGCRAHLSISRSDEMGPFRRRELRCLKHHAPVMLELLTQHVTAITPQEPLRLSASSLPLADLIRTHARDTLATHLTQREAQIAALVLQGHSNGSAALVLDIAAQTAKVHRRNLYRKLAISSQRDLFGLLKHLL